MADEFGFVRIDGNRRVLEVFKSLQRRIKETVKGMKPPKPPEEEKGKKNAGKKKNQEEKKK
jgi:hypothetical protein